MSHLIRVRGLKPVWAKIEGVSVVAPYTGAWIETENIYKKTMQCKVAPYTGAWIETISK